MTPFAPDQWVILLLVFFLGLFLGMYLLAGGRWKRRYREEVKRRDTAEVERHQAEREAAVAYDDRAAAPVRPGLFGRWRR